MAEEEQMTTTSGQPHPAAGIADMIDLAYAQDYTKATEIFNDQIGDRQIAALDQEKIAIAAEIFNEPEETDNEELEAAEADETDDSEEIADDEESEEAEETEEV